jgi:hypothetical protein
MGRKKTSICYDCVNPYKDGIRKVYKGNKLIRIEKGCLFTDGIYMSDCHHKIKRGD